MWNQISGFHRLSALGELFCGTVGTSEKNTCAVAVPGCSGSLNPFKIRVTVTASDSCCVRG